MMRRQSLIALVALAAAVGLAVTSLFAWASLPPPKTATEPVPARPRPWEPGLVANRTALRSLINDPSRMEGHIRELTRTAAIAGSAASMHQVEYVENYWRQLGFKIVRRSYEVPMSYFNSSEADQPSVSICQTKEDGSVDCSPLELDKPLTKEDEEIEGISRTFYSFSKPLSGDFGLLLLSDVMNRPLDQSLAETLANKLVLIQANETSAMEFLMQRAGNVSTGFLLVHTPPGLEDAIGMGQEAAAASGEPPYPNGTGSPDTAVTFHLGMDDLAGDPSTPGYPSKWFAVRRVPQGGWDGALNATVVPVSQADTSRLLEAYFGSAGDQGLEAPLPTENPTPPPPARAHLRVNWPLRFGYRTVHDSCAEVPGWAEPDRVVLLGSHRDAWYGGAIDPHTGMATMLEAGRALAQLMTSTGWRPRRTILMCAWDAEEIGLVGSVEWVEEEYQRAGARLVAYFNTDTDVMGNWKILVQASDQMRDAIRGVMSEVPNPTASLTELPAESPYFFFHPLDDSSDYYAFTGALGVPACDLSYIRGSREALVLYDLYHTRYETLRLYRLMDPGGLAHLGLTREVAALVYTFADSPLLPLNMSAFADGLRKRLVDDFVGEEVDAPAEADVSNVTVSQELLTAMRSAIDNATSALRQFEERLSRVRAGADAATDLQLRMLNDKIMLVQKAFTHHCILPCQGSFINLLNGLDKAAALPLERVAQAVVFGLFSVPKILTDSFVEG